MVKWLVLQKMERMKRKGREWNVTHREKNIINGAKYSIKSGSLADCDILLEKWKNQQKLAKRAKSTTH